MEMQLRDIWIVAGVLMGFQVTSFAWRISREVKVAEEGDLTWLPPADLMYLVSMVVVMVGVFVLPTLGLVGINFAKHSFALALLLFVGYPFALAGHYDMYNCKTSRSYLYFPFQEKVVVTIVIILVVAYLVFIFV